MKIAQIAPLFEAVPPRLYGGTERIVHFLTEELVALGHEVTLFASADSITSARLAPCCDQALRLNPAVQDSVPYHMVMLSKVRRLAGQFDILHFHIDQHHFPLFQEDAHRTLTTLHGRQDLPDLQVLYSSFPEMGLVTISDNQRGALGKAAAAATTILHGIPRDLLGFSRSPRGGYLAFLGRVSPEKGLDRAIAIARAVGMPLKIAAKVDPKDEDYFRSHITPMLNAPGIDYVGEIGEQEKGAFLGDALALLFPVDWPEPFGLAMIEAMACGTPVLAFRRGSAPEVVDEGVTGYIAGSVQEAVCVMGAVLALDRGRVRRRFEERFTSTRMARDYLRVYERMCSSVKIPLRAKAAGRHFPGAASQGSLTPVREGPPAAFAADDRL